MGSSKSGSLDKFAPFSPAAALASGKVKLPETGLIGMMQGQAEDNKVNKEQQLANQVAWQQQTQDQQQYMNQMQQQMQQNMQSMPGPYAQGGHVALRRKMFKLGGEANTHGVGITSGLEYNAGGSVRQGYGKGDLVLKGGNKFLQWALKHLKGQTGGGKLGATKESRKIMTDYIRGSRKAKDAGWWANRGTDLGRVIRGAYTGGAGLGTVAGLPSIAAQWMGADSPWDPVDEDARNIEKIGRRIRQVGEGAIDYATPFGEAWSIGDLLGRKEGEGEWSLSDFLAGRGRGESDPVTGSRSTEEGITPQPVDFAAEQASLRKQQMEEAMQMYQDLMDTGDDSQKWRDLGNALIAGGSSLMEGGGWGPSAVAFNEPLAMANARKQERDDAVRQMAASQAIADVSSQDQLMQAAMAEQLGAGDYSMAEATKKFSFAQQSGINTLLPTNEKGEVDTEKLALLAGQVVADVTNATGEGGVFVAIATDGTYISTNDIEEAKRYAAS